jgi:hypothetical protein
VTDIARVRGLDAAGQFKLQHLQHSGVRK